MAVEDDYAQLVHDLGQCLRELAWLHDEVSKRRLSEARERLEPNSEDWVNLIAIRADRLQHALAALRDCADAVLESSDGVAALPHDFGRGGAPGHLPDALA